MNRHLAVYIAILAASAAGVALSASGDGYTPFLVALVAIATLAGVGLNILIGLAGQMSFGHVGFYSIGAYTVSLLLLKGLSFWLALPIAALLSGLIGGLLALPALRVSGPYLAMMTIAFAFIVEHVTIEWQQLTGGQNGLVGIPPVDDIFGLQGERALGLIACLLAGASLLAFDLLARGRWGKAIVAVRDSETAAGGLGFSITLVKTLAFVLSAMLTGIAGGCFAVLLGYIAPSAFPFSQSILFVLSVIVGGAGTTLGPLIGAGVTVVLPELIASVAEYRLLLFSVLLIVILWLAPNGIIGSIARLIRPASKKTSTPGAFSIATFLGMEANKERLEISGLSIAFGGIKAASEVSFAAEAGKLTGLIGPNGAGKTTVLNLVSGYYRPDDGRISLGKHELQGRSPSDIAHAGIARTYQTTQLFSSLSVIDNVALGLCQGALRQPWQALPATEERAQADGLLRFVGYRGDVDAIAASLPHVDRRLVEIARALAARPKVLLLDEPAAGLNAEDKTHLSDVLGLIARAGLAVILVEHDMDLVMRACDHLVVLDAGRVIATGKPEAIRHDATVRAAYLGAGEAVFRRRARAREENRALLTVERLKAGYGSIEVLQDATLTVGQGEMVALLGANGAGKSTFLKAISGLVSPKDGSVRFNDHALDGQPAHLVQRAGMALVPEGRQIFPALTVADNLRLGAYARGQNELEARLSALLQRFPRLKERLSQRAGFLSGGEAQMLAIARGLMSDPRLLLLDEPTLGLAPKIVEELYAMLAKLRDEGMTLLLVDQMARFALQIADRGYVMASGSIVKEGEAAALMDDPHLEGAYLGRSDSTARKSGDAA